MSHCYDREGNPISIDLYVQLHTNDDYKIVAYDDFGNRGRVSTVWLGIDHSIGDGTGPLIFETMIFDGPHADTQWRWATEAEAKQGHKEAVALVTDTPMPEPEIKLTRKPEKAPWGVTKNEDQE